MLFHEQNWFFSRLLHLLFKNLWNSRFCLYCSCSNRKQEREREKDYQEWCIEILSNGKLMAEAIFLYERTTSVRAEIYEEEGWVKQSPRKSIITAKTASTCYNFFCLHLFPRKCQLFIECLHVSINYFKRSWSVSIDRPIIIETNKLTFQKNKRRVMCHLLYEKKKKLWTRNETFWCFNISLSLSLSRTLKRIN